MELHSAKPVRHINGGWSMKNEGRHYNTCDNRGLLGFHAFRAIIRSSERRELKCPELIGLGALNNFKHEEVKSLYILIDGGK